MTWRDDLPVLDEQRLYSEAVTEGRNRLRRRAARRRVVLGTVGLVGLSAVGITAIANYDPDAGDGDEGAAADTTAAAATTAAAETTAAGADTTAGATTTAAAAETTAPGPLGLSVTPPEVWETPPSDASPCGPELVVVRYRQETAISQATLTFTIDGGEVTRPMDVAGSEATLQLGPFPDTTTAGEDLPIGLTVEGVDTNGAPFTDDVSVPLRNCPPTS